MKIQFKKFLGVIVCMIAILILTGCGSSNKEYSESLSTLTKQSYDLVVLSDKVGLKYLKVWNQAIFDKYAFIDGKAYSDFNNAIAAQEDLFVKEGTLAKIKDQENEAKDTFEKLKKMKNKSLESEFDSVKEFYLNAIEFQELATNPTGSYKTYSALYDTKQAEIVSKYKSLQAELSLN
ncbi:hypothetical protein ACPTGJ_05000 [Enterococcus faecalis]|uniref:hypothetical protein n=1 Tax=Enterococcus faecalis TaxID=1351 RepID=UPI003CC520C1